MDHAYVKDVGLMLILVDSFTAWPEAIVVKDRSAETVKTVLRTIFAHLGVPRALVSDNAAEFGDKKLLEWLNKIGCQVKKTPLMHPQSNSVAEHMVQTIKKAAAVWDRSKETFHSYITFLVKF